MLLRERVYETILVGVWLKFALSTHTINLWLVLGEDFLRDYKPMIMAFGAPWLLILSVPIFGLACWEFMEYAAAYMLVSLKRKAA